MPSERRVLDRSEYRAQEAQVSLCTTQHPQCPLRFILARHGIRCGSTRVFCQHLNNTEFAARKLQAQPSTLVHRMSANTTQER